MRGGQGPASRQVLDFQGNIPTAANQAARELAGAFFSWQKASELVKLC